MKHEQEDRISTLRRRSRVRFTVTAIGLLVAGIAGYVGFVAFVESDRSTGSAVLVLAASTGFAAFFSPCSFPLLLTFLARRADESTRLALASALRVALGAVVLLSLLAIPIVIFGDVAATFVAFDRPAGRVFRAVIGLTLVLFGLRQSRLLRLRIRGFDWVASRAAATFDPSRPSTPARRDFLYGFGYLLAGFG